MQQQLRANVRTSTGRACRPNRLGVCVRAVIQAPVVPKERQRSHADSIKVALRIPYATVPGQSLGVVGAHPALGSWVPEKALRMKWTEGHTWTAEFLAEPSTGSIDYKYVLMNQQGTVIAWSKDPNRKLEVGSLMGSTMTISEAWDAGPREVRLTVGGAGSLETRTSILANGGATVTVSHQGTAVKAVQDQLMDIRSRLESVDGLRLDVARLLAKADRPLPPWISAKQLMQLTQQLSALEDLRDVVSDLAAAGTLQVEQLLDVSKKLSRFETLEGSLHALIGQLASGGGCPVGYAVGKSIAGAARSPTPAHARPYGYPGCN